MLDIQCPICKSEYEIELNISIKTKGMTVFRGSMAFLGNLADVNALLDFIRETFKESPTLRKEVLINRLVEACDIPHRDACHFVEKLQEEGFMYEPKLGELGWIGD